MVMEQAYLLNYLVSALYQAGVRNAVLSPGSRNAPLIRAFVRHGLINCHSIPDERVAAYTALGMAISSSSPVVVCCTSGTASLNLYPAIAEAYYAGVPLVVVTADRPEWLIDRWDGQAIRQKDIFASHTVASFHLNSSDSIDLKEETIHHVVNRIRELPLGPVHFNVPLDEPLYENHNTQPTYPLVKLKDVANKENNEIDYSFLHKLVSNTNSLIWVMVGAATPNQALDSVLAEHKNKGLFFCDVISNQHFNATISNFDSVLGAISEEVKEQIKPTLLLSIGRYTLSKNLKKYFKSYTPDFHYHISKDGVSADPFFSLTDSFRQDEAFFLQHFFEKVAGNKKVDYAIDMLNQKSLQWSNKTKQVLNKKENEILLASKLLAAMPPNSVLHLANSTSVRYVSWLGIRRRDIQVYSNRGTSGIDGCTSTAIGFAKIMPEKVHVLLTGDIAFFYDVNALWQDLPSNLVIVLVNNGGGTIFRLIDGPSTMPEMEQYMETKHTRTAKQIALDFGCDYLQANTILQADVLFLQIAKKRERPIIIEFLTDKTSNTEIVRQYKSIKI